MAFPTVSAFGRKSAQRVLRPCTTSQVLTCLQVIIESVAEKSAVDLVLSFTPREPCTSTGSTEDPTQPTLGTELLTITLTAASALIYLKTRFFVFGGATKNIMGHWAPVLVWMPSWKFPLESRGSFQIPQHNYSLMSYYALVCMHVLTSSPKGGETGLLVLT